MTDARAGGLAREVVRTNTGTARAGGLAREVIRAGTGTARAGGLAREIVRANTGIVHVDGVVREVLVTTSSTSPGTKIYADKLAREALVQDVIDQARLGGLVREALVTSGGAPPPPTTGLRPYLLINV